MRRVTSSRTNRHRGWHELVSPGPSTQNNERQVRPPTKSSPDSPSTAGRGKDSEHRRRSWLRKSPDTRNSRKNSWEAWVLSSAAPLPPADWIRFHWFILAPFAGLHNTTAGQGVLFRSQVDVSPHS